MYRSFVLLAVLPGGQAKEGVPNTQIAQDGSVVGRYGSALHVMFLICRQMVQALGNLCLHREIPGYTHNYLECWVFELPIDNLKRKRAFGTGTMRTPVSALPVPGNPNG
jgi:hypothetical protein